MLDIDTFFKLVVKIHILGAFLHSPDRDSSEDNVEVKARVASYSLKLLRLLSAAEKVPGHAKRPAPP